MKKIILLFALFVGIENVHADNSLSVGETSIPQGLTGTINIELNNDVAFTAFTLKLTLPEGLSFVTDESDKPTFEKSTRFSDHALSASSVVSNSATFACLSASSTTIKGTSGTLLNVYVKSDADLEIGTELTATLTEATFTTPGEDEYNLSDLNVTVTIDEPRIQFNENAGSLPTYTAGEKGNIRMTRNITAGNWNTIVLPFTLTKTKAEAAFGSDLQLAEFSGFEVDYGDDDENVVPLGITILFSTYTMTTKKGMTGGKPFLIKTSKDITSFEANDCSLVDAVTDVNKTDEYDTAGKFTGSFVKTKVPADGLFISNNKFWYSTGKTDIKAFRGWFELGAVLNKETNFEVKMLVMIDGEETRVEGLNGEQLEPDAIYDLSGRKVSKPKQRGIYIVDGIKTLIK